MAVPADGVVHRRRPHGRCQKGLPHVPDRKHTLAARNGENFGGVFPVSGCPTLSSRQTFLAKRHTFASMACFFAPCMVFRLCAWKHGAPCSTTPERSCSEKTAPLLHSSRILTGMIDAYLCRCNGLVSKRQTFLAKHTQHAHSSLLYPR
jgi:hypothetical protein